MRFGILLRITCMEDKYYNSLCLIFLIVMALTGCVINQKQIILDPKAKSVQKTVITNDKEKIAWQLYASNHAKLIIIAHGFYNSKEALLLKELAQELSSTYDVAVIDFRGHGKSSGLFHWTSKEYIDLLAVIDEVKDSYDAIGVIGFSLGAATSLITASKTDLIKSVIAVSPPSEFEKIEYRLWELDMNLDIKYSLFGEGRIGKGVRPGPWWLAKEKPIDIIATIKQPVYYIHGTKDWIIKPWHSQTLFDKTNSVKKIDIIQDGPHAEYLMLTHKKILCNGIKEWFLKTLR